MDKEYVERVKMEKGLLDKREQYSQVALPFTSRVRDNISIV